MKFLRSFLLVFLSLNSPVFMGPLKVAGTVLGVVEEGETTPLAVTNVYWLDSQIGTVPHEDED